MNINNNYGQNVGITNQPKTEANFYEKGEPYKKVFEEIDSTLKDEGVNVDAMNMPAKEKEVLEKTLNQMENQDISMTLMLLNAPSSMDATPQSEFLNYDEIMKRIDNILNPPAGGEPSAELEKTLTQFKELFAKNFDEISEQNEQNRSEKDREAKLSKAVFLNEEN